MKLTVITVSSMVLENFVSFYGHFKNKYPNLLDLSLFNAISRIKDVKMMEMEREILASDMVIIDLMGSDGEIAKTVLAALDRFEGQIIPIGNSGRQYLRLGSLKAADMSRKMMRAGMTKEQMRDLASLKEIDLFWKKGRTLDILNLTTLLLKNYGGVSFLPEPERAEEMKPFAIKDPKREFEFDSYEEYRDFFSGGTEKPVVALFYYGHNYPNDTSYCVAAVMEKLQDFAQVLPIAFGKISGNDVDLLEEILLHAAFKKADLAINFISFRLGAGPMGGDAQKAVDMLEKLEIPVMHPYFMTRRSEKEWRESAQGSTSSEFILSIMMPEIDGCIETYPIGSLESKKVEDEFDLELVSLMPINERVDKLVSRVRKWLALQKCLNQNKKVAIICYNYPPGEDNIFGGAFLDTLASVESIFELLIGDGYNLEKMTAEELKERFLTEGLLNTPRWSDSEHNRHYIKYQPMADPNGVKEKPYDQELIANWGDHPGDIMVSGKDFLIPGIINGNVFLGLQPSRGIHEQPEKAYHDKDLPPHHQYLAFYQWIKEEFKADAVIHVGTHGTLEFLKGKECGMSEDCYPDLLMGDLPHIYLYYLGNPAEAMIAKRRSHGVLVSYQAPVFMVSGLYGEITELAAAIDEYHHSLLATPARSNELLNEIKKTAEKNHLPTELEELEKELYTVKRSLIPQGLHCFNQSLDAGAAKEFGHFVLRYERDQGKSLRKILAEDRDLDYEQLLEENNLKVLEELDKDGEEIWERFVDTGEIALLKKGESGADLMQTFSYAQNIMEAFTNNNEGKALLNVLRGKYLKAKLAGDPIRNPEVLPAGYNLYQFDPRFIPTAIAYQRGAKIMENTIKTYREAHGTYPVSTAVILWGIETSRTQGETIGQILASLGVEVVRGKNIWEPEFRIIPQEELKRPRIDILINICGFFRDMFPNIIESLNDVFEKIRALDESDAVNYYRANYKKTYGMLKEAGYENREADELAGARIFGPGEAGYGTGISKLLETGNWTEESQIGNMFIDKLSYIYSKNYRGRLVEGLFEKNLQEVDLVSQVRSSHEYEVTDLDHYYEFFGGLAKSVELARGERCEIYISDTTGENIITEQVEKSISRGLRTRLLNPKWIEGMLSHPHHGGQKIQERFENMLGLAATTNRVDSSLFSSLHQTYVSDQELQKRMSENNPWAYMNILERLMETNERGYWNAEEKELEELKKAYLELEGSIEERAGG